MKAFLTGSQAYGTATEFSDIDLVVRMGREEIKQLIELSGTDSINCLKSMVGILSH